MNEVKKSDVIGKELTLTHLKRLVTKELSGVFEPVLKLTKVDYLFTAEDFKTFEDYKEEMRKILSISENILKERCVLACESLEGEVLMVQSSTRPGYEHLYGLPSICRFYFDKKEIPENVKPIAYVVLLDEDDCVLAKQRIVIDAQLSNKIEATFYL